MTGNVTSNNVITANAGKSLDAGGYTITLTKASGDPLAGTGTFTASTSTVIFTGASPNISPATYYNVVIDTAAGVFVNTVTTTNNFTVNSGKALDLATYTLLLTKDTGTPLVVSGTLTPSASTVNYTGTSATIAGNEYYNLIVNTAGTLGAAASTTNNLTVNSGKSLDLATYNLNFGGNIANSGNITQTSGIVTATGTTKTLGGSG